MHFDMGYSSGKFCGLDMKDACRKRIQQVSHRLLAAKGRLENVSTSQIPFKKRKKKKKEMPLSSVGEFSNPIGPNYYWYEQIIYSKQIEIWIKIGGTLCVLVRKNYRASGCD